VLLVWLGWTSEQTHGGGPRPMEEIFAYDGVLVSVTAALIVLFRRRLSANRVGRQTTLTLAAFIGAATASDALTALRGGDSHDGGPHAMLSMACVLVGAAIGFEPRMAWSAAAFAIGGVVAAIWPSTGVLAMGGAAIAAGLVILTHALGDLRGGRPGSGARRPPQG
jgi:hypothetical protein